MSSTFGKMFSVTTWGESHGVAVGAVVDGCPAGVALSESSVQPFLDRRKPGGSPFASGRKEEDKVQILSGVFEGKTTGTPISLIIYNNDVRPQDYNKTAYRPGHADYTYDLKYGFRDYRGGGRASGRETAARVAAGAVARLFLAELGVDIQAYTHSIGDVEVENVDFSIKNDLNMPDEKAYLRAVELVEKVAGAGDSLGGKIFCRITGVPDGVGEPVFDKLEAVLAHAMLSIGAVKSFEFGDWENKMTGSEYNDWLYSENGVIKKKSNHAGGIYGGISDGSEIYFKVAVKPTPSIALPQASVDTDGNNIVVETKGRHDPLIVPRAVAVVEAMAGIVLADLVLVGLSANVCQFR